MKNKAPQTTKSSGPAKGTAQAQKMGAIHNTVGKAAPNSVLATKPMDAGLTTFPQAMKGAKDHISMGLQALTAAIAMPKLSDRELAEVHTYVKVSEDALEEASKYARARVLDAALTRGAPVGETGASRELDLGDGQIQRVTIQKQGLDPKKFEAAVRAKGAVVTKYMDTVVTMKLKEGNTSADLALADNLFTADELSTLMYEPSYRVDRIKEGKKS